MTHMVLEWVQVGLLAAWIVVTLCGWVGESREQNDLRKEIELLNERMDRAGLPSRLPVHVVTTLAPDPGQDEAVADTTETALMPVVGRHRIERRTTPVPPIPEPREVTADASVVDVDD